MEKAVVKLRGSGFDEQAATTIGAKAVTTSMRTGCDNNRGPRLWKGELSKREGLDLMNGRKSGRENRLRITRGHRRESQPR